MPQEPTNKHVFIEAKSGSGRTIVLIYEEGSRFVEIAEQLFEELSTSFKTLLVRVKPFTEDSWKEKAEYLDAVLTAEKLRTAALVAFGNVCPLAQKYSLEHLKMIRSLSLVDATTRPHPRLFSRVLEKIERGLPVGLPFRYRDGGFNTKPFAQRMRFPVLLIATPLATSYQRQETMTLAKVMPTAWLLDMLQNSNWTKEIAAEITSFQDVAHKVPQKGRSEVGELAQNS